MEVLRRCPLAIAQRLVHCAIALSTAVLDRVTKTMSVAPLLMNNLDNSKQKTSNLLSPAPPPYSWSLLGKSEGPAPPPSSKISWSRLEPCDSVRVQCCFTSTETIRTIRDGEPRTGHLHLYTAPELSITTPRWRQKAEKGASAVSTQTDSTPSIPLPLHTSRHQHSNVCLPCPLTTPPRPPCHP